MTGRFAPTPSGRMHIGNITAMLAAWLDTRSPHTDADEAITPDTDADALAMTAAPTAAAAAGVTSASAPTRPRRMLLRIEDIDTPRVLPDADRWIMDDLDWLGLDWDGEPVYQSQRLDLYEQALDALHALRTPEDTGSALIYPCFCSRADIRAASAPQEGDGFQIYPGTCRRLLRDHPGTVRDRLARDDRHSLRIAMPDPASGADATATATVAFTDRVFGLQSYDLAREIGDSVIRRSDGLFAYQFVVTVDDLVTGVDSIVRGRDLLRSTALQTYIRDRLVAAGFDGAVSRPSADGRSDSGSVACTPTSGWSPSRDTPEPDGTAVGIADAAAPHQATPSLPDSVCGLADAVPSPLHPAYAHIPLIDNAAGRRLAKRERSLDMGALRARGVTAEQVIGYCAWLLRLVDCPEPCAATDLLPVFSWNPLRKNPADRALKPDDPTTPPWLADALRA